MEQATQQRTCGQEEVVINYSRSVSDILMQWWATFLPARAKNKLLVLLRAAPTTLYNIHPYHFFPLEAWRAAQELLSGRMRIGCPSLY